MATKRMLIDATHPEETRVAVIEGDRLTEYDVEIASRRQLKGNIYLAKVTRVEPSLQAAFVDYGGNRHGFLAFNEIHPDYYQIPVADREALLAEQAEAERADDAKAPAENGDVEEGPSDASESGENGALRGGNGAEEDDNDNGESSRSEGGGESVEVVGGIDEDLDVQRPRSLPRHYKIQEVIKRRQILLVQVVKEERGTKGAALTTYLSIAGRYCVLMPNTTRGGGISRKITNATDRKRLKKILGELGIPEGMAVIVRTAGAERSKAEIRRDYEYLIRLWNNIRELVLTSMAPTLVYEEGNLIKRSLRDLYDRDTDEILIEGESAYRVAKDFMKLFIPSHAKKVQLYEGGNVPLFHRHQVENELEAMHLPRVELKSGGSIVLNPTEALVAVDVNSGRSTRERHIEETALRTNLEACDEIARQLRLRDLAGLIVIDFIDMENARNQAQVERRLKEAIKSDRARVQLGRISTFGLLELSRQRLRPSLFETSFTMCTFCAGTGVRRTTESTALSVFRRIEHEGVSGTAAYITVKVPPSVAFYLLNNKRRALLDMEQRFGMTIFITGDDALIPPDFDIHSTGERPPYVVEKQALVGKPSARGASDAEIAREEVEIEHEPEADADAEGAPAEETDESPSEAEEGAKRSRRRRPRRRRRPEAETEPALDAVSEVAARDIAEDEESDEDEEESEEIQAGDDEQQDDEQAQLAKKRRRRGKRGGRRRPRRSVEEVAAMDADTAPELVGLPEAGPLTSSEETLSPDDVVGEPDHYLLPHGDSGSGEEETRETVEDNAGMKNSGAAVPEMQEPTDVAHDAEVESEEVAQSAPEAGMESEREGDHGEPATGEPSEPSPDEMPVEEMPEMALTATPAVDEREPSAAEAEQTESAGPDWPPDWPNEEDRDGARQPEGPAAQEQEAAPEPDEPEPSATEHSQPDDVANHPRPDDSGSDERADERERETVDMQGDAEVSRSVTVNTSRTVVINVGEGEDAASLGGAGGRRGWWQRLIS